MVWFTGQNPELLVTRGFDLDGLVFWFAGPLQW
jgi:hypothetical protein